MFLMKTFKYCEIKVRSTLDPGMLDLRKSCNQLSRQKKALKVF